jgi:hypothetical protein
MAGIWDLVFHPDAFFARVSDEGVDLRPPLAMVGTGIIVTLLPLTITLAYYALTTSLPMGYIGWMGLLRVFLLCNVVIPLTIWGVMSLWTYGVSRSLGGKGSLTATVRDTGWGMMPWTLSIIAFALFSGVLFVAGYAVPATVSTMEVYAPMGYEAYTYLALLILLWEWYLWALAARHTHGFWFRKSAVITGIPVILYLIVMISALGWFDMVRMLITGA